MHKSGGLEGPPLRMTPPRNSFAPTQREKGEPTTDYFEPLDVCSLSITWSMLKLAGF
jgi:hypothetical protein